MNTDYPENFISREIGTGTVDDIMDICCKFDFPDSYFSVFFCIHLCTPKHFQESWIPQAELHKLFDTIDLRSPELTLLSIALWEDSPVKAALLYTCSQEVRQILELLHVGSKEATNTITQLHNMQLLYLNAEFRMQMLTLYTFFIKPYLTA